VAARESLRPSSRRTSTCLWPGRTWVCSGGFESTRRAPSLPHSVAVADTEGGVGVRGERQQTAASGYEVWGCGLAHIVWLSSQNLEGRSLGSQPATVPALYAISDGLTAQWRCRAGNIASRLGERLSAPPPRRVAGLSRRHGPGRSSRPRPHAFAAFVAENHRTGGALINHAGAHVKSRLGAKGPHPEITQTRAASLGFRAPSGAACQQHEHSRAIADCFRFRGEPATPMMVRP